MMAVLWRVLGVAAVLVLSVGAHARATDSIALSPHMQISEKTVDGASVDEWLTFTLAGAGAGATETLLVLPNVERAQLGDAATGNALPFASHALPYWLPVLAIPVGTPRTAPIRVHVHYYGDQAFNPSLRARQTLEQSITLARLIEGLFVGALLAVIAFNTFAFFGLRERSSVYFAIYVLSLIVNEIITTGLGGQYLWPSTVLDARLFGLLTNSIGFASFVIFARSLLETRRTHRRLDLALIAVTVVQLGVAVAQFALPFGRALTLPLFAIEIVGSLLVAAIGIVRWRDGYQPARFFVIAFLPSTIGVLANLYYDAFLPAGNWFLAQNGVEIGTAIQSIIISCSIVDRMRTMDRERRKAQRVAATDALTGIPNRMAFYDALQGALDAATPASHLGILYIDLDGFKPINDRHGHRVGDELLRIVAQRLESTVRSTDLVARIGGDEFAIFLREVPSSTHLERIATNVRRAIGEQVVIDGTRLRVDASVGIATYPESGTTTDGLVESADRDMYVEKRTSKI